MLIKKNVFSKAKFVLVIFLFIVLVEGIYLVSPQRSNLSSSHTADKYRDCDKFQDLGSRQQCWEDLIEETLRDEGLESAFILVDSLYGSKPKFASDCHGFTHLLGEKAYKLFSQNQEIELTSKASYCGFGFYHAFMESLLRTTGDLNQARQLCEYVGKQASQNELSRLSCFHGIGHGLLEDIPNPTVKGDAQSIIEKPLEICVQLSKSDTEIDRCASGVFNVLAIYYRNPNLALKIRNNDPYLICKEQKPDYFRNPCFDQMNTFVLFALAKGDFLQAVHYTKTIANDEDAKSAIHGLAGAYGQNNVGKIDYDKVAKDCKKLQDRLRLTCIESFVQGLIEGGKPKVEHFEGVKFCNNKLLSDEEKKSCFDILVWNVSSIDLQQAVEVCNGLKQRYRQNCIIN